MQDILNQFFEDINKSYQWMGEFYPLPYLFTSSIIHTETEPTLTLRREHRLKIENRKIVPCKNDATHEVTDLLANSFGKHSVKLKDLETEEIITLNLED